MIQRGSMKKAFTLSEILITLGIIGVVAAMTLPSLITNYQKKVWTTLLKKNVSLLEQCFQKMLADEGVEILRDVPAYAEASGGSAGDFCESGVSLEGGCLLMHQLLSKYLQYELDDDSKYYLKFKFSSLNKKNNYQDGYYGPHSASPNYWLLLNGGSVIFTHSFVDSGGDAYCSDEAGKQVKASGGKLCAIAGAFYIDVNGVKKPNILGRDMFEFTLGQDGHLYPGGGKDVYIFYQYNSDSIWGSGVADESYWRNDKTLCGTPGEKDAELVANGRGCAARIIENGWVMDY